MRKRKGYADEDDISIWEVLHEPGLTGTIQQLTETPINKKFKPNRPIGFLADIDNYGKVSKPIKSKRRPKSI